MPPKRAKSRTGSAKPPGDQGLAGVLFNEEGNWSASLAFVVGDRIEDYAHIGALVAAIKSGTRKLFSSLSREDLFNQALELGNTKSPRKGKDVPQFSEICEPCKQHLDNGEDIPLPLLAKLIKFKLLDIKSQDIRRREAQTKALEDRSKSSKGKPDKKDRSKSPAKGAKSAAGKGKAPPEPAVAKAESKLKKRGEEDLDAKYINDEPDDGPHQYIIITGFHHPHLLSQLSEIGINIDTIINVNSQSYVSPSTATEDVKATAPESATTTIPQIIQSAVVGEDEEKKMKERERTITDLKKFWRDVLLLMQKAPDNSSLHDVARLEYTVPDSIVPSTAEDMDAKGAFGATLFEVVACMMYNLLDAKRQWKNYLSNLRLIHVPQVPGMVEPVEVPAVTKSPMLSHSQLKLESVMDADAKAGLCPVEVDMRRYNDLMNSIPLESVSVPLVMHCMLEQVCSYENQTQSDAEQTEKSEHNMNDSLARHLNTLAFKLALSTEERKSLIPDYVPPSLTVAEGSEKQPILISYHDDLTRRLNHLQPIDGFNPVDAELQMLGYSPASAILSRFPAEPDQRIALNRAARFQELLFFCTQKEAVSQSDISRALQQFVFECMNLTMVDENGRICRPLMKQTDIPWDDPYPYYIGMIPDTDERVKSDCMERPDTSLKDSEANKEAENDPGGLSRSGSILRRPESLGSRKRASSCHSVHFEEDDTGQPVPHPGDEDLDESKDCSQSSSDSPPENSSSTKRTSLGDLSDVVNDRTKRNLDQFQYAEHMEPTILLQALLRALETHPYVDTYYQKRDNSFLVVLQNPHDPSVSQSFDDWHVALHSNIRFRNYLEYVAGGIVEWTQTEEAKYEARLLAAEVEKLQKEGEEPPPPSTPTSAKRGRSKSPKKADSRATARSPSASSLERSAPCESFVRAGSLKAWKEDQARIKAEEEQQAKLAEEKRAKSAQKKPAKDTPRVEEKKPKEKEKESKKQTEPKAAVSGTSEQPIASAVTTTQPEKYWPFTGYDVGDKLIHIAGVNSTLFPDDGGQIITERIQYLHGSTSIRASVRKGGHSFTVHVIDPKQMNLEEERLETGKEDAGECTAESVAVAGDVTDRQSATDSCLVKCDVEVKTTEDNGSGQKDYCKSELSEAAGTEATEQNCELSAAVEREKPCVGRFGSFTAQFNDGMTLAVSTFGPSGEPPNGKPYEPESYTAPVQSTVAPGGTTERDASPAKRSKAGDKTNRDKLTVPEVIPVAPSASEIEVKDEVVKEIPVVKPFQQLFVTCPDGLNVTYLLDSSLEESRLLVRQNYPVKTKCLQKCDAARKTAMREQSRVITSDGTVIKTMTDGTTQVLFADGTVSEYCFSSPLLPPTLTVVPDPQQVLKEVTTSASKKKVNRRGLKGDQSGAGIPAEEEVQDKGFWITTLPTGERIANRLNGASVEVPNAVLCVASDPQTLQVMHTREDHVITIYHPDGLVIVEHSDGTRITTKQQIVKKPLHDDTEKVNELWQQETEDKVIVMQEEDENQKYPEVDEDEEEMEEEQQMNEFYIEASKEKIIEVDETEADDTSVIKFVLVECSGYASVKFDSASGLCSTEFGSGCVVDCMVEGRYDVCHPTGGFLRLDPDGTAVYYDQSPGTNRRPQYYVMRHFDSVIAETIDRNGTHYIVTNSGENHVNPLSNVEDLQTGNSASFDGVRQPSADVCNRLGRTPSSLRDVEENHGNHVPRLFVVHCDGTGQELLRPDDVAPFLSAAERDPDSVVLKGPLPNCTNIYGITVLRPLSKNASQTWLKGYLLDSIIPAGLKSHDLRRGSPGEVKTQTSLFNRSSKVEVDCPPVKKAEPLPPVVKQVVCPSVLEFRQLIKCGSVSEILRTKLNSGLKAFADHVKKRAAYYKEVSVQDTRLDEERAKAEELQARLPTPCATPQGLKSMDDVKSIYEKALTPIERPRITCSAKMRMKKYDMEKVKQELAEEEECRNALRLRNISPYFKSELAEGYNNKQNKCALTKQFLGYVSCGTPVQSENIEEGNECPLPPPPGIACQHLSPEPEEKCEVVKLTDRESKTPEGCNLNNTAVVNDVECSAENETAEVAFDSHEGPADGDFAATEGGIFDRLIVSESTFIDKKMSPKAGDHNEESWNVDQLMKPLENDQKPANVDALPTFKMPDFKGLLADIMSGNSANIEKSLSKFEKASTENAGKDLKEDSARNKPNVKCDKGLQDFQRDPCTAANGDDECGKLIQKLAISSRPVSNCDEDDPMVVALTTQNVCQQHDSDRQPDCSHVTMGEDYDSMQQVTAMIEASELDNSKCQSQISPGSARCMMKNAVGEPLQQSGHPPVPGYLSYGKRPGATPNTKFARVEESVRRKVNNVIVTGATPVGCQMISRMRGLEMAPERVDFGVLKEGSTYALNLSLQNTGVDACRFRVKQPPPSTGVKILYKPGPVAAGMKTDIQVEIYAIAAGVEGDRGVGLIAHNVEITTETDQMLLPVTATVLTANEFDCRSPDSPKGGKSPGVKLVSNKPPAGIGLIRPRKHLTLGESVVVN